jgi:hypothetical protein
MTIDLLPDFLREHYQIYEWRHACAILKKDFRPEWDDIITILSSFQLLKSHIVKPGGSKTDLTIAFDEAMIALGWRETQLKTKYVIEQVIEQESSETVLEAQSHKIDCYKAGVGLELEWNSKDQTFDRDLNNFRLLFEAQRLSVGVIITRSSELHTLFKRMDAQLAASCGAGLPKLIRKYGGSTTHMAKLLPRVGGGRAGGCPILVFGIKSSLYVEDISDEEAAHLLIRPGPPEEEIIDES